MPYCNDFASGEALWRLVESDSGNEFKGRIRRGASEEIAELPKSDDTVSEVPRGSLVTSVIDGSTVTSQVRTAYPGAEAALLQLAADVIYLERSSETSRRVPSHAASATA